MKNLLLVIFFTLLNFQFSIADEYIKQSQVEMTINGHQLNTLYQYEFYQPFNQEHFNFVKNQIGVVFPPFSIVSYKMSEKGNTIFDVKYRIGEFGERVYFDTNQKALYHLIISGDSNSFGEGCNDSQTLDFFLQNSLTNYQRYNYSHRGGGPNNTLALFETFSINKKVKETSGIMIYNFYTNFLFQRTIGSKESIKWNEYSPFYYLNENGEIKRNGSFRHRPLTYLYKFINLIPFSELLFPELPRIHDHHVFFVAKLLEKIQHKYLEQFPQGKFIVILNNFPKENVSENSKLLSKYLDQLQVKSASITLKNPEQLHFVDLHLNPRGHQQEAEEILKVLLLNDFISDKKH